MPPTVSVIMSVYNCPDSFLAASIDSILGQTEQDLEFIIVDDGASEKNKRMLSHYACHDSRVTILKNVSNIGLTKSLNIGIKAARGKYIARMDADDISLPNRLETQISFMDNNLQIAACGCSAYIINESGQKLQRVIPTLNLESLRERNILFHGTMLFRRDVLDQLGGYDESMFLSQDYELYLRLIYLHGMKIISLDETMYMLRRHRGSLSYQKIFKQLYYASRAKALTIGSINKSKSEVKLYFLKELLRDAIVIHKLCIPALLRQFFPFR